jgi:quinol monooxygenase YgiN
MVQLNVPGKRWEEALSLLRPLLHPTRVQPGCLRFDLLQDLETSGVLLLLQEWDSEEHLQNHLRSQAYESVLAAMEVATAPPEITFSLREDTGGLDIIQRARLG